jgi:hypothetical protein
MKACICVLAAIGVLFSALPAWADPGVQAAFYNDCITQRIINCQKKVELSGSNSPCMKNCARLNARQAKFLEQHRDRLVKEMMTQNVRMEPYVVDYYLITTFFDSIE